MPGRRRKPVLFRNRWLPNAGKRALGWAALIGSCWACGERDRHAPRESSADASDLDCGPVQTTAGWVRGHPEDGVCAFHGIPFAAPPVGADRWREPAPPHTWAAPLDADSPGPPCPQVDAAGRYSGDEDCLTLNLWMPAGGRTARNPVLVFVHGGGNVSGDKSDPLFDGAQLASRGLVVVVPNYRLGALGYLAHPSLTAESPNGSSGNYGLADLVRALEWVRSNIDEFGGGRYSVTAFGQSAGSRSLCALLASRLAKDLFQGAVLQSGTCDVVPLSAGYDLGARYADSAGCSGAPDVASCLRALDAERATRLLPSLPTLLQGSEYNPRVDGWLLTAPPLDLVRAGVHNDVSVLIGSNREEPGQVIRDIDPNLYPAYLELNFGTALAAKLLELYPLVSYPSPRDAISAIISEARYFCPLRKTARTFGDAGIRTWRYFFTHRLASEPYASAGAFHGLELAFIFRNFDAFDYPPTAADLELSDFLQSTWARMSRLGTSPPWPEYTATSGVFTVLDAPITLASDVNHPRCDFWDALSAP